jgi:ubiquinone/menaquinone biosynthesis C-methylase UbiE
MLPAPFSPYVCPRCRGDLTLENGDRLACGSCAVAYPIVDGIPNFIRESLAASPHLILRRVKVFDWVAHIYESKHAYPLCAKIYAGWQVSYPRVLRLITDMAAEVSGLILDVACGPGTLGRRLAGRRREIYGIDVSWGMLRQGAALASRERIHTVHFARALAEALPFPDRCFDAGLCGVALHLLAEPLQGLREICRTLKPGALLIATTIIAGESGLFKFQAFRQHLRTAHGMHVFSVSELSRLTAQAGFEDFQAHVFGSLVAFRARKTLLPS